MRRLRPGPAVATSVVAAAGAVLLAPATGPAAADPVAGGGACEAVTVLVDPGSLGAPAGEACTEGGPDRTAAELTESAGFDLAFVPGTGFVCRVDGSPGSDQESCTRTPPADAYWGLFWAEDASSPWTYATLGATALTVPDDALLGWRWQDGGAREEPGRPAGNDAGNDVGSNSGSDKKSGAEVQDGSGGAVPSWAAGGVVVLLGAAVGGLAWRRRSG